MKTNYEGAPDFEAIYKLKDHEMVRFDSGSIHIQIIRVPHGWIYTQLAASGSSSVFVPFINSKGEE